MMPRYRRHRSAEWGLTNGVRVELAGQGTLVSALVPTLIATDTLRDYARSVGVVLDESVLYVPADLARMALDGIEAGEIEMIDRLGIDVKQRLTGPPAAFDLAATAGA
jgi:short-subunit dehydrogenase